MELGATLQKSAKNRQRKQDFARFSYTIFRPTPPAWTQTAMSRRKTNPTRSTRANRSPQDSKRIRNVWLSLVAAMTAVGGGLLLVDSKPAGAAGMSLMPAVSFTTGSAGLEPVFSKLEAPLVAGRWKAIVIHHSAKPAGSGAAMDEDFRRAGMSSLGHHFVIGNGRGGMEPGELYVGYRWTAQQAGAHAKGPKADWHNQNAISICLIGDGDRKEFDDKQMQSTAELVTALCKRLDIPTKNVILHRDIAKVTDPGRTFPEAWLREQIGR